MSMTIEEGIKYFTQMTEDKSVLSIARGMDSPKVLDAVKRVYEANELALTALREKAERENPAPLTIEELRQMDEQPVYVVPLESHKGEEWKEWCVLYAGSAAIPGVEYFDWSIKDYGKTWIAYRHKPKEETP